VTCDPAGATCTPGQLTCDMSDPKCHIGVEKTTWGKVKEKYRP
jgi:hypothetical protein